MQACTPGCRPRRYAALHGLSTRDDDDFTHRPDRRLRLRGRRAHFLPGAHRQRILCSRTARERVSLQEMGRLIGYRLRPGVAAETWLAFTLETPPLPPAACQARARHVRHRRAREDDPRLRGCEVRSVPGPGEKPQTFETVEAIDGAPRVERDASVAEPVDAARRAAQSPPISPA